MFWGIFNDYKWLGLHVHTSSERWWQSAVSPPCHYPGTGVISDSENKGPPTEIATSICYPWMPWLTGLHEANYWSIWLTGLREANYWSILSITTHFPRNIQWYNSSSHMELSTNAMHTFWVKIIKSYALAKI